MAMNKRIKNKWLKQLRSGEIEQATGTLKRSDGMCCLGVVVTCVSKTALKKLNLEVVYEHTANGDMHIKPINYHSSEQHYMLVPVLARHLGIPLDKEVYLAQLNDGSNGKRQHTFAEIADYIEENL